MSEQQPLEALEKLAKQKSSRVWMIFGIATLANLAMMVFFTVSRGLDPRVPGWEVFMLMTLILVVLERHIKETKALANAILALRTDR